MGTDVSEASRSVGAVFGDGEVAGDHRDLETDAIQRAPDACGLAVGVVDANDRSTHAKGLVAGVLRDLGELRQLQRSYTLVAEAFGDAHGQGESHRRPVWKRD